MRLVSSFGACEVPASLGPLYLCHDGEVGARPAVRASKLGVRGEKALSF